MVLVGMVVVLGLWGVNLRCCTFFFRASSRVDCDSLITRRIRSGQDPKTYLDQTDLFYASPSRYLLDNFPQQVATDWPPFNLAGPTWPSHLVVFSNLLEEDGVGRLLIEKGYVERERRWNSLWHEDERRRGEVVLLEWKGGK